MLYEIVLGSDVTAALLEDLELVHDNPEDIIRVREVLLTRGAVVSAVTRNGIALDESELRQDVESYQIRKSRERESKLRSTYRAGRSERADYGETSDGRQARVWRPPNPEDRFE